MNTSTQPDIERLFKLQTAHKWFQKNTSIEHRKSLLTKLRSSVLAHAQEVVEALYEDLAKPRNLQVNGEVDRVVKTIDDALKHLAEWAEDTDLGASEEFVGGHLKIQYEAKGVVLIFGPWNFPFQLLLEPLVPTIAAGNTAILKPNEMTPATSRVSARIIRETFDEKDVAAVEGGVDVSNALLALPVDHIFFTGSPAVGKIVMQAAAQHLASVTLELGGKCPVVIDRTVDLQAAVELVVEGRQSNAGQVCLATDYAFVPNELRDEFVRRYWDVVDGKYYVDGKFNRDTMARIIDRRNAARVQSYVDDAVERGAVNPRGGRSDEDEAVFHPTLLLDVPADAKILKEEIFGPVLPILTYTDVEEVIEFVQAGTKPLAMYILSDDIDFVNRLLAGTSSGGVTVNGWGSHYAEERLPFGGVNHSGIGRYHGVHGFRELSHERAILLRPPPT
jgi:aldehyde dehydrogenase (NAD+)